jgi:hypothetical protein
LYIDSYYFEWKHGKEGRRCGDPRWGGNKIFVYISKILYMGESGNPSLNTPAMFWL